ncbi:MAG: hypothetical protein A2406_04160 [Candidatus Komeilibacteria bacterium RIFOXYC1_FULL_37_11]|uniref:Uncharacterized protein n=1 Tax=Candidatus Komeilibacteria bacterium RIFOXYC1_FULL_37_11 TaxID=1798555 RepID=A0A1G2BXN0_9BACT|nr:MAG: hypothetical protein A2406_04160 [Candidatus Komeilibacteria bacterium RIFOXYC1_FULL_37_11]OGY95825.1 MAG: hypothetical protein A2611_03560 [Candidatus Komeilibacteria bacterium RIFOXYD1_FULL_37_29]
MKKKSEVTNLEILDAINDFSTSVDKRFDGVESRLDSLEYNQENIISKLDNVAHRFEIRDLEKRVGILENK